MSTSRSQSLEDLLRDVAAAAGAGHGASVPSAEDLEAYRTGRLSAAAAQGLERSLAASRAARLRLAELAGVAEPAPPAAVRERVLAEYERLRRSSSASASGAASLQRS